MLRKFVKILLSLLALIVITLLGYMFYTFVAVPAWNGFKTSQYDKAFKENYQKNVSTEVLALANEMAEHGEIHNSALVSDGIASDQFSRFQELSKKASPKELALLTNHPSAAVRAYAFWSYLLLGEEDTLKVGMHLLEDSLPVETLVGCIYFPSTVKQISLELLTPNYGLGPTELNFTPQLWNEIYAWVKSNKGNYEGLDFIKQGLEASSPK